MVSYPKLFVWRVVMNLEEMLRYHHVDISSLSRPEYQCAGEEYLPVQGNEWDPPNAVHVAMMKYWNEHWGAELVAMAPGNVEMRVLQPPITWEEAFTLAKEQYIIQNSETYAGMC